MARKEEKGRRRKKALREEGREGETEKREKEMKGEENQDSDALIIRGKRHGTIKGPLRRYFFTQLPSFRRKTSFNLNIPALSVIKSQYITAYRDLAEQPFPTHCFYSNKAWSRWFLQSLNHPKVS